MASLYVVQITACLALVAALCVFNILFLSLDLLQPRFYFGGFCRGWLQHDDDRHLLRIGLHIQRTVVSQDMC
jgi:hypothetical protein